MARERELLLPDLGAGPHAVRVVQWLVDRGSEVVAGDRILEVAATGVLFVVNAPWSGSLRSQRVGVDSIVAAGDVVGVLEVTEEEE